jgi:O-antigen/teichoic acid export membrane protein
MDNSLKSKAIIGTSWSLIDNIASSGITFLAGLVLARLLSPHDFGLLGMITVFIAVSNSLIDSGFGQALIRKTDIKPIDYNTVFYFNVVVGIFLYIALFAAAPAISIFFHEPKLILITRVTGTVLIINSVSIIQRTLFTKQIDFRTQTKVSLISSLVSGIIGIGLALKGFGVWSLIVQQLSRQLLSSVFLWVYCSWVPKLEYSFKSFKELFGFGSKLLISGLIDTIYRNIYYLVIGKYYSASELGQYTRAEQFNSIFSSNLTSVVQRVSYPVLSSIHGNDSRLKEAYRKVIKSTMLVSFALMLGLAAIAKSLILILIGEKWIECIPYLQIICFGGMLYPLHAINLNILQVKGRSDLFLRLEIIKKCIAIPVVAIGILFGIKFMLVCSVLTSFFAYFLNSYYSAPLLNYPTLDQIKDIIPTFLVSLIVASLMWSITLINLNIWLTLAFQITLGLVLMISIYEKLQLFDYLEVKQVLLTLIRRK